ncbi:MAG: fluoride efflux transporter FluC, partial [Nocardioides sp.]
MYVALGAALGAPLRYALGHWFDEDLPLGTIAANVVGSFMLGWFTALALAGDAEA